MRMLMRKTLILGVYMDMFLSRFKKRHAWNSTFVQFDPVGNDTCSSFCVILLYNSNLACRFRSIKETYTCLQNAN